MKLSCPIKSNFERKIGHDIFGALMGVYGMSYAVCAYVAPNHFFGPNGLLPTITKTSLESNNLDPITEHYMRCQGVSLIALILGYYLFAFGDLKSERAMIRSFFVTNVVAMTIMYGWLQNNEIQEYYELKTLNFMFVVTTIHTLWLGYLLMFILPKTKETNKAPMPPNIDSAIFYACALYASQTCAARAFLGADHRYFPTTPLENNAFGPTMNVEAQAFGFWFIAPVYILLFEAQNLPRLTYKNMILYMILALPEMFKVIYEEGYGDQKALSAIVVADVLFMALAFYRLGAFDREYEVSPKKDDAVVADMDEGMHLRDGRVVAHKAQ